MTRRGLGLTSAFLVILSSLLQGEDTSRQKAISRGLSWLAGPESYLPRGGSYLLGDAENPAPIAVTSLATLAFLAGGACEGRGKYEEQITGGIGFLLRRQLLPPVVTEILSNPVMDRKDFKKLSALSPKFLGPKLNPKNIFGYFRADNDQLSRTHGLGYATLCLAQAMGMAGFDKNRSPFSETALRTALLWSVYFIERIQGPSGGWYYYPYRDPESHEGSVTICLVQALRAARNAGVTVNIKVIRNAEEYVRRSQKKDGSFRYQLGGERSSCALTAAALATLNMAGRYEGKIIDTGLTWLRDRISLQNEMRSRFGQETSAFPLYERLYIAQTFWQGRRREDWQRWWPKEKRQILRTQLKSGAWESKKYGRVYATAVNCLVLLLEDGYLPIFQR